MPDLHLKSCTNVSSKIVKYTGEDINPMLNELDPDWFIAENGNRLERQFAFDNYAQTISFVNAIAFLAERQDHHPDMKVRYKSCDISFTTHTIGSLSQNDFICAARIDQLLR